MPGGDYAPVQLSACTDSVSGSGLPNGSNKTKGIPLECSLFRSIRVRLEKTRMAPSVCRRSMLSIQDESGCWRLPPSVVMTFKSCNLASRMAPRSTSRAQTYQILEHDFDNSLAFCTCRFTGIPIPFQHRVDGLPRLFGNVALPLSALDTVERE